MLGVDSRLLSVSSAPPSTLDSLFIISRGQPELWLYNISQIVQYYFLCLRCFQQGIKTPGLVLFFELAPRWRLALVLPIVVQLFQKKCVQTFDRKIREKVVKDAGEMCSVLLISFSQLLALPISGISFANIDRQHVSAGLFSFLLLLVTFLTMFAS